jgi:hypothetical protein
MVFSGIETRHARSHICFAVFSRFPDHDFRDPLGDQITGFFMIFAAVNVGSVGKE